MPNLAEMDTKALGSRLAIVQALYKLADEELKIIKSEMKIRLLGDLEKGTADSVPLTIGGQKVGRYYATKPSPGVCDEEEFGEWACEHGKGWREIKVIVPEDIEVEPEDIDMACETLEDWGCLVEDTHVAQSDLRKSLKVIAGRVVDDNGELVPGTYVKAPQARVTRIDPHEVADAMRLSGDNLSVAGLLDGD